MNDVSTELRKIARDIRQAGTPIEVVESEGNNFEKDHLTGTPISQGVKYVSIEGIPVSEEGLEFLASALVYGNIEDKKGIASVKKSDGRPIDRVTSQRIPARENYIQFKNMPISNLGLDSLLKNIR